MMKTRLIKYVLFATGAIIPTLLSVYAPIKGLEIFGKVSCGDPSGLPFAFNGLFKNVPEGALLPQCIQPLLVMPFLFDIIFWFLALKSVWVVMDKFAKKNSRFFL